MLIVTVDLDWASEPAIEETLDFFQERGITPTVFATHRSSRVESSLKEIEVGLHPFFHPDSSHGKTTEEVIEAVLNIPHNVPAFRCHRYAVCNESNKLMVDAGMKIASNICTDLEIVPPFIDRFGLIQVPIYFEDGGYLWNGYPLVSTFQPVEGAITVMNIHPMHFALNTPSFDYMVRIKRQFTREAWIQMSRQKLTELKHQGEGIQRVIIEFIAAFSETGSLVRSIAQSPRFSTKIGELNVLRAKHRSKSSRGYWF